jgi:SAM-dependent methyltransferase
MPELVFTGERQLQPDERHVSRYEYAKGFCSGKYVLDAACGTGYGSLILASVAHHVAGADVKEAIEYSKRHRSKENVKYVEFNLESPSFNSLGKFDVIVSLETIEHLRPPIKITFQKFREILNDGGILIACHPVNEPDNPPVSRFHVHFKLNSDIVSGWMMDAGFNIIGDWQQVGRIPTIPHHMIVGVKS